LTSTEYLKWCILQAGLFSAIVGAAVLDSYKRLSQQPEDAATALLGQIKFQLANLRNPDVPSNLAPIDGFVASPLDIAINILWFSSLIITLNAVLMAILVKQWLAEYTWSPGSKVTPPHQVTLLRQLRFDGLTTWKIPQIISYLPSQLLLALFLFLAGVLCLLWGLHLAVAVPATILIALSFLYLLFTSTIPAFYPTCGYQSPQAWLVYRVKRSFVSIRHSLTFPIWRRGMGQNSSTVHGWVDAALEYLSHDSVRMSYHSSALMWMYSSLTPWDSLMFANIWNCALTLPVQVIHRLMCGNGETETRSTIRGKDLETAAHDSDQSLPGKAKVLLSDRPVQKVIDAIIKDLGYDHYFRIYDTYVNGLGSPNTLGGHPDVLQSTTDAELGEYIVTFRALHLTLLCIPEKTHRAPDEEFADRISRGTRILAGLLDVKSVGGARLHTGSERTTQLQRVLCGDLRRITLKNWQHIDMLPQEQMSFGETIAFGRASLTCPKLFKTSHHSSPPPIVRQQTSISFLLLWKSAS
jgi:hypothetical protein